MSDANENDFKFKYLNVIEKQIAFLSKIFDIIYREYKYKDVELGTLVMDFQSFEKILKESYERIESLEYYANELNDNDFLDAFNKHYATLRRLREGYEEMKVYIQTELFNSNPNGSVC